MYKNVGSFLIRKALIELETVFETRVLNFIELHTGYIDNVLKIFFPAS